MDTNNIITLAAITGSIYIVYKIFYQKEDMQKLFSSAIGNKTTNFDVRVESQIGDIKLDMFNPYRKKQSDGVLDGGVTTTRGYMGIPKQTYHTEDGGRIQIYAKDPLDNPFVTT